MAEDYSKIDEMVGSMKAHNHIYMERMTPSKNEKKFEVSTKVSADPKNALVADIMASMREGDITEAKNLANASKAPAFLNAFIDECVKHGGQEEGKWMFARLIHKGKKGKNATVQVELGYAEDGGMQVVDVPKSYIYAITGQKWRKIGANNLLPQLAKVVATTTPNVATSGGSIDNVDNPPHNTEGLPQEEKLNSGQTPPSPSDEIIPVALDNDPLVNLIGGQTTQVLKNLGLRDKVQIADIDMKDFTVIQGKTWPIQIIGKGNKVLKINDPIAGSNFGPIGWKGDTPFDPQDIDKVLYRRYKSMEKRLKKKSGREEVVAQLRAISVHMDSLSRVFGFDDPQQLEAFFAAWLMEDSTCRLTGIPGTGKTTVINSAATLLSNSYGFNQRKRYIAKIKPLHGSSHEYMVFPSGQRYDVNYGDKNYASTRDAWELWRFTEWEVDSDVSGSYLWDFRFLQEISDSGRAKIPLSPDNFADFLLAKPDTKKVKNSTDIEVLNTISAKRITKPQLALLFGENPIDKISDLDFDNKGNAKYLGVDLYSDSGGNEGFVLRHFLLEHFFDSRLNEGGLGVQNIVAEMLEECGVAKIDYDKRAEEILYGIEIRQITEKNPLTQVTTSSYQFDPTPRPVVTQPIKFFNEANRSGSGVEDAILGLIAEKTVEYRGQRFTSPNFVAWMDTNPHQKGNDLAFVDRIDMELYFGTLSLGGRFNTLVERYGGVDAEGSTPEIQLLKRMLLNKGSSQFIIPMRFHELKKVWKTVNNMDFNASGSVEDQGALLDISLLSVLFTQKYMVQGKNTKVYGMQHDFHDVNKVYNSPLADISTTTNSQYVSQHADWWGIYGKGKGEKYSAPVTIERMLGFRFTNSMVKMTRALAFLRGKTHVTRQEVLDSLPYCVGHRLGPAREGEDPKGRDIGINREAMVFENEQQYIRDLIINGYVLRNTKSGLGNASKISLLDIWDSFVKNCQNHLSSTNAYWKYERDILLPIKEAVRKASSSITPVHWSIATMMVDNVKRQKDYQIRYGRYLERIQRPEHRMGTEITPLEEQKRQLLANNSASQYFKIRGEIAGEPKLFTDDRGSLLSLVDSKIKALCGNALKTGVDSNILSRIGAVAPLTGSEHEGYADWAITIGGPKSTEFVWRAYGDGMGAWGNMITQGVNASGAIANVGSTADYAAVAGAEYEANQTLAITHQILIPAAPEVADYSTFTEKIERVVKTLREHTGEGVSFSQKGTTSKIEKEFSSIRDYQSDVAEMLGKWVTGNLDKADDNISIGKEGFNACFVLKHHQSPVSDAMKTLLPNGKSVKIKGDDTLRLWLCLRCIQGDNAVGDSPTMGLFIGITSACMRPTRKVASSGTIIVRDSEKNPVDWEVLPFKDKDTYNHDIYGDEATWNKYLFQDIGNMTTDDYRNYVQMIMTAVAPMDE